MNLIIIILVVIFISILASILVIKAENKKDKILLEKKIKNEFIKLYKKENYKVNYKEYLKSEHWKNTRLKALDKAGNRCQLCCSTYNLNVHHNTYKNKGHEDPKDLVVLCGECHKLFHDNIKLKYLE